MTPAGGRGRRSPIRKARAARWMRLATTNSTIAWTAPTISYLVIRRLFHLSVRACLAVLGQAGRGENQNNFIVQIINIAVGALTAAFATVVNFWLGSSAGSRKKDDASLTLQQAQAERNDANIKSLTGQNRASASGAGSSRRCVCKRRPPRSRPISRARRIFDACMPFHLQGGGRLFRQPRGSRRPDQFRHHAGDFESLRGPPESDRR